MTNPQDSGNTRKRRILMLGVPAVLLAIGSVLYLAGGREVTTDNAYVKALTVDIVPEVAGKVIEMPVKANDRVKQGDLLFAIDPADYRIAVKAAEADLLLQWARVEALRPEMRAALEQRRKASTEAAYYAKEVQRLENLRAKQAVSESQLDDMRHRRDAALAEAAAYEQEYRRAGVALGFDVNLPKEKHPFYQVAEAQLEKAKLDLERTRVTAPKDGVVTNKMIAAGDQAVPGRTALSLVQDSDVWVEANLKETELAGVMHRRAGARRTGRLPGRGIRGHGGKHQPGHRRGVRAAAAAERFRQLGEGGATHPGAHPHHPAAGPAAVARGAVGGSGDRHRPQPLPAAVQLTADRR